MGLFLWPNGFKPMLIHNHFDKQHTGRGKALFTKQAHAQQPNRQATDEYDLTDLLLHFQIKLPNNGTLNQSCFLIQRFSIT
ncbi:hypothetical protein T12_15327 [Trichinella patagoniensis]|uniref:Uncharacterized protein n=1 Tax=Trichinella patagoniensis TaxID=990121 RepID=A0A0V0Z789_9BILA|nr:hypothetical protein T12_15327 [Trichinella patagoniensis]